MNTFCGLVHLLSHLSFDIHELIMLIILGPQSQKPISVPTLLNQITEKVPDHPALRIRDQHGEPRDWSYQEYHQDILNVAR